MAPSVPLRLPVLTVPVNYRDPKGLKRVCVGWSDDPSCHDEPDDDPDSGLPGGTRDGDEMEGPRSGKDGDDNDGSPARTSKICSGSARVLKGNAATIGKPGGFSGSSVGNIMITAAGAAIIPKQWGMSKAELRPFLSQISAVLPVVGASFNGVVDIVGGAPPKGYPPDSNVRDDLMDLYPDDLIIELPGASQDYGRTTIALAIPLAMKCPDHTKEVPE